MENHRIARFQFHEYVLVVSFGLLHPFHVGTCLATHNAMVYSTQLVRTL